MYRTHTCGELRLSDINKEVTLSGWVAISRDLGGLTFVDLRDRYGITQLVFDMDDNAALCERARNLGREFVVQASGTVRERASKNPNRETGDIEIRVTDLKVLNTSKTPPFTIQDDTDGGDDLRMKYRYLDLRRNAVQKNLLFRSNLAIETRKYLAAQGFVEVETPNLIKSTPEGARDFVVPSRMNKGQFYALPQSPQTFKQILMVAGFDKYFQIVKCFRDEDLRADRQPEFTQIDCEMSFIHQEDILNTFEGLTKHLFKNTLGIVLGDFPRMTYDEAMRRFGSDKPDLRFGMEFVDLSEIAKGKGFQVFDSAGSVIAICAPDAADYSRKQLDELTEWVKRPQIGAKGLVYVKYEADGSVKSSVDKFYGADDLKAWLEKAGAQPGDMLLILCGEDEKTRKQLSELRLEMGSRLGLRKPGDFKPLWVVDFPLLEWDEEEGRFFAMHHPFTSPKPADIPKMESNDHAVLKGIRADAYDLVLNGVEIGGGSIRIHDRDLQSRNFRLLGFTPEEAEAQFGFLLGAFEYGAPPHGGIAFGFDRLSAVMNGVNNIRDFIAFPKNNQGRDMMIDAPDAIKLKQLEELGIRVVSNE
ncbi:MAG: aspartate--tRNA ligase [Haliscomenobacteraceae bacterium CHB4]|nr:Aspartate--tRNA ligase [Saprospiraceae bacterium]MCE7921461.1 aspartate--tRNA ligase [Haliscomenobacteraceae bacterium CHB4]